MSPEERNVKLVILGLPRIEDVNLYNEVTPLHRAEWGENTAFLLSSNRKDVLREGLRLKVFHRSETMEDARSLEGSVFIEAVPRSRHRRARKMGWIRLRLSAMFTGLLNGMAAYLLLVSAHSAARTLY
jgi:hypothetical protein